jgi:hypothetical protein
MWLVDNDFKWKKEYENSMHSLLEQTFSCLIKSRIVISK